MKFVTDLNKGILGTPDSPELWSEIINQIPDSVLKKPGVRILNVACGHATEAVILARRMLALGVNKKSVNESIWLIDKYQVFTNPAKKIYGFKNVVTEDFLNWNPNMKFDVVLGNPPYQKAAEHGKKVNDNLWAPFTFKAWDLVKDNGYLAFITPDGWRTPTNDFRTERKSVFKDIISQNNTIAVNLNECERHFSVGSTISYFVVQKNKDTTNNTSIVSTHGTSSMNLSSFPFVPRDLSKEGLSIFYKVISTKGPRWNFVQKQTKLNKSLDVVVKRDANHKIKYFDSHGSADIKYCQHKGEDHNDSKIMLSYVGKYKVMVDDGKITPAQHAHREVLNASELDSAESQLSSKLYKFIIEGNRSNQYIEKHIPNMMPRLDLSVVWSDADLYKHFKLTKAEIKYIESNA